MKMSSLLAALHGVNYTYISNVSINNKNTKTNYNSITDLCNNSELFKSLQQSDNLKSMIRVLKLKLDPTSSTLRTSMKSKKTYHKYNLSFIDIFWKGIRLYLIILPYSVTENCFYVLNNTISNSSFTAVKQKKNEFSFSVLFRLIFFLKAYNKCPVCKLLGKPRKWLRSFKSIPFPAKIAIILNVKIQNAYNSQVALAVLKDFTTWIIGIKQFLIDSAKVKKSIRNAQEATNLSSELKLINKP